jgi:hypothetical protein
VIDAYVFVLQYYPCCVVLFPLLCKRVVVFILQIDYSMTIIHSSTGLIVLIDFRLHKIAAVVTYCTVCIESTTYPTVS